MKKLIIMLIAVLFLTSCGTKNVASVGDIKISEDEFVFYLNQIKEQMKDTELAHDEDWQNVEIEGKKAIDVAKEMAMKNAVNTALYIEASKAAGVKLTDDEKRDVRATKETFIKSHGGETEYKAFLKESNIRDSFIEMMCESSVYRHKIYADMLKEAEPKEEEIRKYYDENKTELEREVRRAKHILLATVDTETNQPKSEEEQNKAAQMAEDLLKRIENGADFDALMHEYSEDPGLSVYPDGYVFGTGEMLSEFERAVDYAEVGDVTFAQTEVGYHIIKKLPVSYEDVKTAALVGLAYRMTDEQAEEWQKEFSVKITQNDEILKEIN